MKPMTDNMQKAAPEATVEDKDVHSSPCRKKTAVIGFGVIAVLLVLSIVIAVITFVQVKEVKDQWEALSDEEKMNLKRTSSFMEEIKMTEDSKLITDEDIVEANITYHLPLLNETIEEKVVVTDDEEDITTPELRIIYDYNRGYVVTHFVTDGNGTDIDICFVSKFTPHETTSVIKAAVKAEKRNIVVMSETTTESYTSTGETFDRNLLSERASAMCQDSRVIQTKKDSEVVPGNAEGETATRKKRSNSCIFYRCQWRCILETRTRKVKSCHWRWFRRRCHYKNVVSVVRSCKYICYCLW